MIVYPQLEVIERTRRHSRHEVLESSVPALDGMLGGGLVEGSTTLLMGAAGTGKSSLTSLYVHAAARRGNRSALFIFDEDVKTYLDRARGMGMDLRPFVEEGLIRLQEIRVGEISQGEFSQIIRKAVEEDEAKVIVIDSLTGYYKAIADEHVLLAQMYKMLGYMRSHGVFIFLVVTEHGLVGGVPEPHSITLLADTVVLIRFFESSGRIRRALAIFKNRFGPHARSIREMTITSRGIEVGGPLGGLSGILRGAPTLCTGHTDTSKSDADAGI